MIGKGKLLVVVLLVLNYFAGSGNCYITFCDFRILYFLLKSLDNHIDKLIPDTHTAHML